MKFHYLFPLVIIFLSLIIGVALYPYLPDVLAIHWGINGEVNGYASKTFALFFMPGLNIFLLAVFLLLPKTYPYKKSFDEFDQYYYLFTNIVFAFLFYTHLLTIFWHLGTRFNMLQAMSPGFAILYYYAGILMKTTHRNWFVGVRTPWTLKSNFVWEKTHQLGAVLFQITGLLCLVALFVPQLSVFLVLVPILVSSVILFVYSYVISLSHHRS